MPTNSARRGRGAVLALIVLLLAGACGSGSPSGQPGTTPSPPPTAPTATSPVPPSPSTTNPTTTTSANACRSVRPESGFYEAGRVGTKELVTPASGCTTISVSGVRDTANAQDRCQTFLVGLWPMVNGQLTYTDPVTACGDARTVLARNVPDGARYIVIYQVDYIEPKPQTVQFEVWH